VDDWTYDPPATPLRVVHADRDLVVVDKPSGLLSVPGRDPGRRDSALTRVQVDFPTAVEVHRLDLDTSGLLVFALRKKALRALMAAFRERRLEKRYVARVDGSVEQDSGVIDLPLSREAGRPRSFVDREAGRASRTRYRVVSRDGASTLLDLVPETGRSHQLRVHLLALGHPILGDRFYAPPGALAAASRLLLHAAALTLPHPWSGAPLTLRSPPDLPALQRPGGVP
jgi:tRNA pseudouridine32 synthase/23S rRNA pseudouridine746 synthase